MTATQILWRHVWNRVARVGHKRHDPADVARILYEHGARSAEGLNAVRDHVAASIPQATIDADSLRAAQQRERELAECGYSVSEMRRTMARGGRLGGRFAEVAEVDRELNELHRAVNLRHAAIEAAESAWWVENEVEVRQLCRTAADELLRMRATASL